MDTANPERTISREVPRSPATDSPSTQADMSNNPTPPNAAEREQSEQPQSNNRRVSAPIERGSGLLSAMLRRLATFAIALVAVLVSIVTWDLYVTAPWTRDGRIRVQVASVAPEVAGKIKELRVVDNPFDFEVSFRTNKAVLEQRQADQHVKELQSERRKRLSDLATTPEEQQVYEGSSIQAKAAVDAAQQQIAQADINLQRTHVRSPVNGYVTNLLLREGDYAHTGVSNITIIDTDSFWIDGYFEETKLARLCVGDRAEAKLMGYALPIVGRVTTVTRGVSVSNAATGAQGLPNVDPVYTWVTLAQRVPIRIAIDDVPAGVPLGSGITATVTIRDGSRVESTTWFERAISILTTNLSDLIRGASSRPGCIPPQT